MDLTNSNDIRSLLQSHGFRFSKALGQNFLIADWVPQKIAESSLADADTGVLEIGPGIGCLTEQLSLRAGKVVALELDKRLQPLLQETLSACANVKIIFADAMKTDIDSLIKEEFDGLRPVVCANLPYQITSPVLLKLLDVKQIDIITVMIQREVAERICASPGTADYGAFSLRVQWDMKPEILFTVSPSCFMPQPGVTSAVIRMTRRDKPPVSVRDGKAMFRLIRAAFGQRRKTLANAVSSQLPGLDRAAVEQALRACGLDTCIRGENLTIEQFAQLSDELF
jgi:16S rRNA (adenine1518-N6/adenine1519-N6)-dimethyltransferase